jgi:hypothetical protein
MRVKNIIIIILYALFIEFVAAQYGIKEIPLYENFRLVSLEYENASGEKAVTNFEYNENNLLVKALWQVYDNSRSGIVIYKHNEYGNIIEKNRVFSDSITIMQKFEYNKLSKLIIDDFKRSDGTIGLVKYVYDESGNLLKAICNKQNGWFTGEIIYEYGYEGNIEKGVLYQNDEMVGTINYFYNQNGLLIKEHWDFPNIWNQTFLFKYKKISTK